MRNNNFSSSKRQHGAALIVSLILLIVLTLYGLSTSNLSIMQVKMTGSNNESQVALHAAEAAAKRAEADIEVLVRDTDIGNTFYTKDSIAFDLTDKSLWLSNTPPDPIRTLEDAALLADGQEARYFIVYLGEVIDGDATGAGASALQRMAGRSPQLGDRGSDASRRGGGESGGEVMKDVIFKIVGMGTSVDNESIRLVESFYRRPLLVQVEDTEND